MLENRRFEGSSSNENALHQVYPILKNHKHHKGNDSKNPDFYDKRKEKYINCICRNGVIHRRRNNEVHVVSPKMYNVSKSNTDVGVGSIKTVPRKKVKRVYLPDTNSKSIVFVDMGYLNRNNTNQKMHDYFNTKKKVSVKCTGVMTDVASKYVITEKLSPIFCTKSATTSPKASEMSPATKSVEIGSNTLKKIYVTAMTQVEHKYKNECMSKLIQVKDPSQANIFKDIAVLRNWDSQLNNISFDSLINRLEKNAEKEKIDLSMHLYENKIEKEYRKIFTPELKDTEEEFECTASDTGSILKRFEALRRGITNYSSSDSCAAICSKVSSEVSMRDVSIVSDPPSLEAKSYSKTNTLKSYSDYSSNIHSINLDNAYDESLHDRYCAGKFGDKLKSIVNEKPIYSQVNEKQSPSKPKGKLIKTKEKEKKDKRKFFFFKKTSEKQNVDTTKLNKNKKEFLTGRCEIKDGFILKIEGNKSQAEAEKWNVPRSTEKKNSEVLTKTWLRKFLTKSSETKRNAHVRWKNKRYLTCSSTDFEMRDYIHDDTDSLYRSRSDTSSDATSRFYSSERNHIVNFFHHDIEAWMIPITILNKPLKPFLRIRSHEEREKKYMDFWISDPKWTTKYSNAFARDIDLVIQSQVVHKVEKCTSSEYIRIDVPKDFFSEKNINTVAINASSDEVVYKIVEYETPRTSAEKKFRGFYYDNGDYIAKKELSSEAVVETELNTESLEPDEIIPMHDSNIHVTKTCDVVGVGIVTQNDRKEVKQSRKPKEISSSEESTTFTSKNFPKYNRRSKRSLIISKNSTYRAKHRRGFAENYLQEYYRQCIPFETRRSCVSDKLHFSSDNNTGTGTCSSPRIACTSRTSSFQRSTLLSCPISSCSQYLEFKDETTKLIKRLIHKSKPQILVEYGFKRIIPKDSLEVFKKRKEYAKSNKSEWMSYETKNFITNLKDEEAQQTLIDFPKLNTKSRDKHVLLSDDANFLEQDEGNVIIYKGKHNDNKSPLSLSSETCKPSSDPPSRKTVASCESAAYYMHQETMATDDSRRSQWHGTIQTQTTCLSSEEEDSVSSDALDRNDTAVSALSIASSQSCINKSTSYLRQFATPDAQLLEIETRETTTKDTMVEAILSSLPDEKLQYEIDMDCNTKETGCFTVSSCLVSENKVIREEDRKSKVNNILPENKESEVKQTILLNSKENVTIKWKQEKPNLDDKRESKHLKVHYNDESKLPQQDMNSVKSHISKSFVEPLVNLVTTDKIKSEIDMSTVSDIKPNKPEVDVSNIIEINFNIKVTQGEKTTEIIIGNDDAKKDRKSKITEIESIPNKTLVVNNLKTSFDKDVESNNNNDIDIKIIIKNGKQKLSTIKKKPKASLNEDFSSKVSKQFQTVSTGHSNVDNVYSVHRATVDLTCSSDKYKIVNDVVCDKSQVGFNVETPGIIENIGDSKEHELKFKKNKPRHGKKGKITIETSRKYTSKLKNADNAKSQRRNRVSDIPRRYHKRAEKERIINEVFKHAKYVKKSKYQSRMNKLRDIIKSILSSGSSIDRENMFTVTSNDLVKDITYGPDFSNYNPDTDSMKNIFSLESSSTNSIEKQSMQRPIMVYASGEIGRTNDDDDIDAPFIRPGKKLPEKSNSQSNRSVRNQSEGCHLGAYLDKSCSEKSIAGKQDGECSVVRKSQSTYCQIDLTQKCDANTQQSNYTTNSTNVSLADLAPEGGLQIETFSMTTDEEDSSDSSDSSKITVDESFDESKTDKNISQIEMCSVFTNRLNKLLNGDNKDINKDKSKNINRKGLKLKPEDVLQCYETKRAVLEIFAEASQNGACSLSKLPKLIYI